MRAAHRLALVFHSLAEAGVPSLVMGGHAVRHYGVRRDTGDIDLHLSPDVWDDLPARLARSALFARRAVREGLSLRPHCFRRFLLARARDGRAEWLDFWRGNHLLRPYPELLARREEGPYGGRTLPFLGLSDLIRSKETERESDWQDVGRLEEVRDARNLAAAGAGPGAVVTCLSRLRSRRGFEQAVRRGLTADAAAVAGALGRAAAPMTCAYLLPFAPAAAAAPGGPGLMGEIFAGPLRQVAPGSARHLALVEAVRRLYKQAAKAADHADKMAALGL